MAVRSGEWLGLRAPDTTGGPSRYYPLSERSVLQIVARCAASGTTVPSAWRWLEPEPDAALLAWLWERLNRPDLARLTAESDANLPSAEQLLSWLRQDLHPIRLSVTLAAEFERLRKAALAGVAAMSGQGANETGLRRQATAWTLILMAPQALAEDDSEVATGDAEQRVMGRLTCRWAHFFAGVADDTSIWSDWRRTLNAASAHFPVWQSVLRDASGSAPRDRRSPRQDADDDLAPTRTDWSRLVVPLLERFERLERLESRFQAELEREKLESLRQLAYGASHEINNPLANIASRAQLLLRDEADPQRRRWLMTIDRQAFRAHEMIADMMLFAKPPSLELSDVDWHRFVRQQMAQLANDVPDGVRLTFEATGATATCRLDPVQISVAIRALWRNALEAIVGTGTVACRSYVRSEAEAQWAVWEVVDTGPGLDASTRRHLFDPFYSGREAGRGLGFGLAKTWRIMELHAGRVCVDSSTGHGARFALELPAGHHEQTARER